MGFYYSDNPVRDAERRMADLDRWLDQFPKCAHCGEAITDETLFDIDGELYHIECAEEEFKKYTDDYIE